MSNGLLAWWRRRTASYGMAGAALCAVPVAVAVLIGFGASLPGVASGLATLTSGPDAAPATPASAQTDRTDPKGLNGAVLALARNTTVGSNDGRGSHNSAEPGSPGTGGGTGGSGGSAGGSGSSTSSAPGNASGGGSSGGGSSGSSPINVPDVNLPGAGGANDTVNSVGNTVGGTVDSVNNTLGGVDNTVNGLLGQ